MTDYNTFLLIIQACSFTVTFALFITFILSRLHIVDRNPVYEKLRWLNASCMLLFSLHYALQMIYGFRAQGDDVGAVINILFYSPAVYCLSYSTMRIGCGRGYQRRHRQASLISIVLILGCFIGGYIYYGSLHMKYALYAMGTLFFFTMLYFVIFGAKEIHRVSKLVDEESGQQPVQFVIYMNTATKALYGTSLLVPICIFYTPLLAIIGPLFMVSLLFYTISFLALGLSFNQVKTIIDDAQVEDSCEKRQKTASSDSSAETQPLSKEEKASIGTLIEQWRAQHGYSDTSINSTVLAFRLGITKQTLIQYLREVEGTSFRIWLSALRIEEAKRLIIEHPDFSNEAIAIACGVTRIYLQNKFKEVTCQTPNEWRESHK